MNNLIQFFPYVAAIIKGNHTNCAQFANSNRLNWLFSRLGSQASSEGTGMLDVLHCVLIDSPEALNMMRVSLIIHGLAYMYLQYFHSYIFIRTNTLKLLFLCLKNMVEIPKY